MSDPHGSVSDWIARLKAGDPRAETVLFERYFPQLMHLARARLQADRRRVQDEEDVAVTALGSFFKGARAGRFPHLDDRASLWKLLATIVIRHAASLHRPRPHADEGESALGSPGALADHPGDEIDPAEAAAVADEFRHLLALLPDEPLRLIALMHLDGHSNRDIAEALGVVERTVERRLQRIRQTWAQRLKSLPPG